MSLQAEQSTIGCLLVNEDAIREISQIVTPDMFTDGFLGRVYFEIKKAFEENRKVDGVILSQKCSDSIISEQEVLKTLGNLVNGVFVTSSVKDYADIVIREYRAKKASEIINRVEFDGDDVDGAIRETIKGLEAVLGNRRDDESTVPEITEAYKGEYFRESNKPKVKLGLREFDESINVGGGDVLAIGARPKTGKSALALQIAVYLNSLGIKVGFFNLEMTKKQMFERLVARSGEIELNRILNATRFTEGEKEKYEAALNVMREMKNLTIFSGSKRVSDIRAEINGKGFDVIVIDYLQLLKSDGKRGANRYAEVGDISRSIKAIAMDFDIPVIILSQLNRTSELKTDKEPTAADFRESGDIEQDVSTALLLWSPEKDNETKRMLKIELNRQGKRCKKELYFDGRHMRFYEVDTDGKPIEEAKKFVTINDDMDIPFE